MPHIASHMCNLWLHPPMCAWMHPYVHPCIHTYDMKAERVYLGGGQKLAGGEGGTGKKGVIMWAKDSNKYAWRWQSGKLFWMLKNAKLILNNTNTSSPVKDWITCHYFLAVEYWLHYHISQLLMALFILSLALRMYLHIHLWGLQVTECLCGNLALPETTYNYFCRPATAILHYLPEYFLSTQQHWRCKFKSKYVLELTCHSKPQRQ